MATPTYELIETTTLSSSASSVTFSSITQDYRDLVIVFDGTSVGSRVVTIRLNGNSSNVYRFVRMVGDGSSASSFASSSGTAFNLSEFSLTTNQANVIAQIMDYSATDKNKTLLTRSNDATDMTVAQAMRYESNSAITSLEFLANNSDYAAGSTFSLYGIAS